MSVAVIVVIVVTAFLMLTAATPLKRLRSAFAGTLVAIVVVPSHAAPEWVQGLVIVSGILLLSFSVLGQSTTSWKFAGTLLILFNFLVAAGSLPGGTLGNIALNFSTALLVSLIAVATFILVKRDGTLRTFRVLAYLLPVLALIGILEQFQMVESIWPAERWIDDIANRPHTFLSFLPGRSMAMMGHPILMGFISVVGTLISLAMMRDGTRSALWLGASGLVAILLSGSRLLLLAFVVVVVSDYILRLPGLWRITAVLAWASCLIWMYWGGQLSRIAVDQFQGSNSFEHRYGVIQSIAQIWNFSSWPERLFGFGNPAIDVLQDKNVLGGIDRFEFFDNQFIREIAVSGILGLGMLVILLLLALRSRDPIARNLVVFLVISCFSFDILTWLLSQSIFVAVISAALATQLLPQNRNSKQRRLSGVGG